MHFHKGSKKNRRAAQQPDGSSSSLPDEPRENLATLQIRSRQQSDEARQGSPGCRRRRRTIRHRLPGVGKGARLLPSRGSAGGRLSGLGRRTTPPSPSFTHHTLLPNSLAPPTPPPPF